MLHVVGMPGCFIQPGDLALVPHGQGHVVASAQGLVASKLFEIPREQRSERYETLRLGGDGERTTMICGLFQLDHAFYFNTDWLARFTALTGKLDGARSSNGETRLAWNHSIQNPYN